ECSADYVGVGETGLGGGQRNDIPWLPATAPNTVRRLIANRNQCAPCSQTKVRSGRLVAHRGRWRVKTNGSTTNKPMANSAHTKTIACIHQKSAKPNRSHRSALMVM